MTLQRRADEGQDKHGLRSEPATEDEKARRIAEMDAENAALRDVNKRLNNDANLLMESNAQLTEENAALRRDAAAWLAVLNMPPRAKLQRYADDEGWTLHTYDIFGGHCFYDGSTPRAALAAAGLMEEEGK